MAELRAYSDSTSAGGVTEQVYQALFQLVMELDIAPGARMVIDKIAADLGVSSTPVREALARLETQGLVTKEPKRGYFATQIMSAEEFADLWEFRLLIEPQAAGRAAARAGQAGVARLGEEIAGIQRAKFLDDYSSMTQFREHDRRLHDLVLELAGNAHARKAIAQAHIYNRMLRVRFQPVDGYHAVQEHAEIVRAIAAGDEAIAEQAMRDHVGASYQRLQGFVR
ncbi:GntR family transcriptional regulator [Leucobacter sp. BZR 635]